MALWARRAGAAPVGLPFLAWAADRGLVPWDVPPMGCELPRDVRGRREVVGAFRGVLTASGTPFVVRQVVVIAAGGTRTCWTCAREEHGDVVVATTEELTEPGELDALVGALDATAAAARRVPRTGRAADAARVRVELVA